MLIACAEALFTARFNCALLKSCAFASSRRSIFTVWVTSRSTPALSEVLDPKVFIAFSFSSLCTCAYQPKRENMVTLTRKHDYAVIPKLRFPLNRYTVTTVSVRWLSLKEFWRTRPCRLWALANFVIYIFVLFCNRGAMERGSRGVSPLVKIKRVLGWLSPPPLSIEKAGWIPKLVFLT